MRTKKPEISVINDKEGNPVIDKESSVFRYADAEYVNPYLTEEEKAKLVQNRQASKSKGLPSPPNERSSMEVDGADGSGGAGAGCTALADKDGDGDGDGKCHYLGTSFLG